MENCGDFLEWLGVDMSMNVFKFLDDPADLVRVSCVSHSWRQFVIVNGFCKELCRGMFPEVACFRNVVEVSSSAEPPEVGSSNAREVEYLEREHRAYASFARGLVSPATENDCIEQSISASSTDNYPDESIENTLHPNQIHDGRPSYWSSEGERDPGVPETLTYKLCSNLCIVHQIYIQPFEAYFQPGYPIYSSKAVRLKMGYSKSPVDISAHHLDEFAPSQRSADDDYVWTYVSPEFPMMQFEEGMQFCPNCKLHFSASGKHDCVAREDKHLQAFKLPRPVLCVGGIVQIELLGRVQTQEMDGLYYICVRHVKVVGRPLPSCFDVDILNAPGECVLKYSPIAKNPNLLKRASDVEEAGSSGWHAFAARIRQLRAGRGWNRTILIHALLGNIAVSDENESEDEDPIH